MLGAAPKGPLCLPLAPLSRLPGMKKAAGRSPPDGAFIDAPTRIRTWDPRIRSPTLCPLSYRGSPASVAAGSVGATVGAAAGFVERDGDLAVRRTQYVQDDAALERPAGWRGTLVGSASSG